MRASLARRCGSCSDDDGGGGGEVFGGDCGCEGACEAGGSSSRSGSDSASEGERERLLELLERIEGGGGDG